MNEFTKKQLAILEKKQCEIYGVNSLEQSFTVTPAPAQRMISAIQQSTAFLSMINVIMVEQISGQVLRLNVTPIPGRRTNTDTTDRVPGSVHSLTDNAYECKYTEFDTAISHLQLDAWAHMPNFLMLVNNNTLTANALSLLMTGWNGVSADAVVAAAAADNLLGQKTNIGWLKKLLTNQPGNYANSADITLSDTNNIDVLVSNAIETLGEVQKNDPNLIVILGSELMAYGKERLYSKNAETPSEKEKIEMQQIVSTFGGLPAYKVPFFPSMGLLVTTLDNLSIYIHNSVRRQVLDNPKRSRLETFSSKSIAYTVEDYELMSYVDRITLPD